MQLSRLPTPIAIFWAAYNSESHPNVRLQRLTDLLEMVLRWSAALAIAELRHANDGALPEDVQRQLRDHVERPTLGRWMHMMRVVNGHPIMPAGTGLSEVWARVNAACPKDAGIEHSLSDLRNHLCHGGGLNKEQAERLRAAHHDAMVAILHAVNALRGAVHGVSDDGVVRLVGEEPAVAEVSGAKPLGCGAWLIDGDNALPLQPLIDFGPVAQVAGDGALQVRTGPPTVQVYLRAMQDRLAYTPVGSNACQAHSLDIAGFRTTFGLDAPRHQDVDETSPTDFTDEAAILADSLVGRAKEREAVASWIKAQKPWVAGPRVSWISAGPGFGKSMLMAHAAQRWHEQIQQNPKQRGMYLHRFRGGDARNSRRAFLSGLLSALADWPPLAQHTLPDRQDNLDADELLEAIETCRTYLAELQGKIPKEMKIRRTHPVFIIIADGLDEIASLDPELPRIIRDLAGPVISVLAAGRPEYGLPQVFGGDGCIEPLPGGLGPMIDADVRTMLLEGLGTARYSLLARDEEQGEVVHNAFIDRVVQQASGLPLYVHLLLEDLLAGNLTIHDEDELPAGLNAYYDRLVERMGLSTVQRDLPMAIACLATSTEPLDATALAELFATPWLEDVPIYTERIAAALRVGASLLRTAPTPEQTAGWTLYHQSLREYILGRPAADDTPAIPASPALAATVAEARRRLFRAVDGWQTLSGENLRRHLFRWSTEYAVWWQPNGAERAAARLTDFAYLQQRLRDCSGAEVTDLVREYGLIDAHLQTPEMKETFSPWVELIRTQGHILRRSHPQCPAETLLLQLAMEHADDSPVTRAAEAWLAETGTAVAIRSSRPVRLARSSLLAVLEGHKGGIEQVVLDGASRMLTRSDSDGVRSWDLASGECRFANEGGPIYVVAPDRAVVFDSSRDGAMATIWDTAQLQELGSWQLRTCQLDTGQSVLESAAFLGFPDALLAVSDKGVIRAIDPVSAQAVHTLDLRIKSAVPGPVLSDRWAIVGSEGKRIWIWDRLNHVVAHRILDSRLPNGIVHGAWMTSDRTAAVVKGSSTLVRIDLVEGAVQAVEKTEGIGEPRRHGPWLVRRGAGSLAVLRDDSRAVVLETSFENSFEFRACGPCLVALDGARMVVVPGDDTSTPFVAELSRPAEHGDFWTITWRAGALLAAHSGVLLRIDPASGACSTLVTIPEAKPKAAQALIDEAGVFVLSAQPWHYAWTTGVLTQAPFPDRISQLTLVGGVVVGKRGKHLWFWQPGEDPWSESVHSGSVGTLEPVDNERLLTTGRGGRICLWEPRNRRHVRTLEGHTGPVEGLHVLPDASGLLSWSADLTVRRWDLETGTCTHVVTGAGTQIRWGGFRRLEDGLLLTTAKDGPIRLWEPDGRPRALLEGHTDEVEEWLRLADGTLLTWCSRWQKKDTTVRRWRTAPNLTQEESTQHDGPVGGAVRLPGGPVLSWGQDKTIRTWDPDTGAPMRVLAEHTMPIDGALVTAPDRLWTWSEKEKRLHIWAIDGEAPIEPMQELAGHRGHIKAIEQLPSGDVRSRCTARFVVRDARDGTVKRQFPDKKASLTTWKQLADGRIAAVAKASETLTLHVWHPDRDTPDVSVDLPFRKPPRTYEPHYALRPRGTGIWLTGKSCIGRFDLDSGRLWVTEAEVESWQMVAVADAMVVSAAYGHEVWGAEGECLHRDLWPDREAQGQGGGHRYPHLTEDGLLLTKQGDDLVARTLCDLAEVHRVTEVNYRYDPTEAIALPSGGVALPPPWHCAPACWFPREQRFVVADMPFPGRAASGRQRAELCTAEGLVAIVLDDGRVLAWHARTGQQHFLGLPRTMLRADPSLLRLWQQTHAPICVAGDTVAVSDGDGLVVRTPSGRVLEWHTDTECTVCALEPGWALLTSGAQVRVVRWRG